MRQKSHSSWCLPTHGSGGANSAIFYVSKRSQQPPHPPSNAILSKYCTFEQHIISISLLGGQTPGIKPQELNGHFLWPINGIMLLQEGHVLTEPRNPTWGHPWGREKNSSQRLKPDYFSRNMSNCGTKSLPNSGEKYFDFEFFSNKCNTCLIGNTAFFLILTVLLSILFSKINRTEAGLSFNIRCSQQIWFILGEFL